LEDRGVTNDINRAYKNTNMQKKENERKNENKIKEKKITRTIICLRITTT
jgi:hypothetical protein